MLPCRRKPSDYEQIVVAPAHPGVQTMESQLNEENVDYASRHRYHHSTTLQTSSRFQQHSDDSEWTAKGSTISATMPAPKQLPESKFTSTYTHPYRRPSQGQITTCTSARLVTNQAHFNCCSVNLLQWSLVTLPALPIAKGRNYSPQVKLWYVLLGRVLQPYQTENRECRFEVQSQVSPSISKPNALQGCRCVTLKALKSVQRTYFLKSSSKVQKSFSSHAVLDTGPVDMLCVLTPIFLVQSSWGHLQHWLATFDL